MIESDRQLEVSKKWLLKFKNALQELNENKTKIESSKYQVQMMSYQSTIDELTEEIKKYESDKSR